MRSQTSFRQKACESVSRVSRMSSGIPGYGARDRRFTPGVVGDNSVEAIIIPFKKLEDKDQKSEGR